MVAGWGRWCERCPENARNQHAALCRNRAGPPPYLRPDAGLLDAGAECVGYNPDTTDPRVLAGFRKRFPHVPAFETKQLLEDPSIDFVVIAARPCDRAELAVAAMQRGKDVMVDKPGVTTSEQLAAVERPCGKPGASGRSASAG